MKSYKHVWRIFQIDPAYLEQKIWFSIIIAQKEIWKPKDKLASVKCTQI